MRQVFLEPEENHWMVMSVTIPWAEVISNGEKSIVYYEDHVQDSVLEASLTTMYLTFKFFNGSFGSIVDSHGLEGLKKRMDMFLTRYIMSMDVGKLDIFTVFQGIQFLPLDKYMYLKVHCFVNLIETTFRSIQRTVLVYNDQLVWSGLEQADIKVFYQYLLSWLLPQDPSPTMQTMSSIAASVKSVVGTTSSQTGRFLIGDEGSVRVGVAGVGDGGKAPWVYIHMDGSVQSCKLYVYTAGNALMCFFVQREKASPSSDFCKRLNTFLGPRLAQISREISDFRDKSKPQGLDPQYRFIYFNEMNLAVKSPLLSRRSTYVNILSEAMKLLADINSEYDSIEEGETIMRTLGDSWVVTRKSGHRRFFVVLNQKSANFAEINEEVRKLCQKEFTNIFFLD
ncbi:vacuolar fusion protein CCZ1 homolog isoform X2 [Halichondria panicea]